MLLKHIALLGDGGACGLIAGEHHAGLAEDPGVADASSCDGDGAHAGVGDHAEEVVDIPDVAGSEHNTLGRARHDLTQEVPARGPTYFCSTVRAWTVAHA
jgi:hypothetical protein